MSIFRKYRKIKPTGHIINMWEHTTWGDNLYWFTVPKEDDGIWKLGTHARRIPQVGDEVRCKMQSGRIHAWLVEDVETYRDPRDMFFADCSAIGYLNQEAS